MLRLLAVLALRLTISASTQFHTFYYLWYGNPGHDGQYLHWNHRVLPHWRAETQAHYAHLADHVFKPPSELHAPFYPLLGCYSSKAESTLRQHFSDMLAHGITVAVVSWTGRVGSIPSDTQGVVTDAVLPEVLRVAEATGMKVAIHLEPYPGRTPWSVREDLVYLVARYNSSSALLRSRRPHCQGTADCLELPVVYVYDSYHNPTHEWAELLCEGGHHTIRGGKTDSVMISTLLTPADKALVTDGCFDGAYSYFATDGFTYGASSANWGSLALWAREHKKLFIPSVGPGYNDTRIRPWNSASKRDREGGAYFSRMFEAALASGTDVISITSYNEWGEGTQIEPAKLPEGAGNGHLDYGTDPYLYLKLTKHMQTRSGNVARDTKPEL